MVNRVKEDYISMSINVAHNMKYVANGLYGEAAKKESRPTNPSPSLLVQFLFQYWVRFNKGSRHTIYNILGSNQGETQNKATDGCKTQPCKHNVIHRIPPDINNITREITSLSYHCGVAICRGFSYSVPRVAFHAWQRFWIIQFGMKLLSLHHEYRLAWQTVIGFLFLQYLQPCRCISLLHIWIRHIPRQKLEIELCYH